VISILVNREFDSREFKINNTIYGFAEGQVVKTLRRGSNKHRELLSGVKAQGGIYGVVAYRKDRAAGTPASICTA
jgi:hypothetical protein